ncbi:cell division ATPase MinD [Halorussus salilacus]|uniref:cell division ATPase MinD n=1 Tax=Halorussus salilacus TaxID=2953750 RepID=UPI0020A05CF7|nr:cell division ATPase MinD [Halorussus salilacus]USZ66925.1 cell division ATPase MinD [Halorussus salilacus]
MSDTVYAIASGKGGVGKTTTAINLGAMLADRDHSVVVVDTDLGMANLAGFLDFEVESPTLHEVLADEATAEEAVYAAPGDIDVLPSATDIEAFAKSNPANLRGVVADLREEYDYVLLDTGAGVSYDSLVPLALADAVLLVATPDVASVRDTAKTGELAERVGTEVAGAVLAQRGSDILNADDVEDTLGTEVLAVVPSDEAVPMGIDAGRPLAAFAPNAPAGQAYRDLAAVVTGDAEPDPELELDEGSDAGDDERVDPEQLSAETGPRPGEDPLTGAEVAENVRDAIEGGDSEGLLGGELASAAEELRRESSAGGASTGSGDGPEARGDDREAHESEAREFGGYEREERRGAEGTAEIEDRGTSGAEDRDEGSTASEARSVDDLIDEHISDDRLRDDSDSPDSETDDPLAGVADDDPLTGGGDSLTGGDDPLAGEVSGDTEGADAPDAGGDSLEDEIGDWEAEARREESDGRPESDESGVGPVPFEGDRPDRDDGPGGTPEPTGADVPGGDIPDADGDAVTDDEEWDGDAGLEDDEDSGGVLGRLGSLFR